MSRFDTTDIHGLMLFAIICPECSNVIHVSKLSADCSKCGLRLRIDGVLVHNTEEKKGMEIFFVEDATC